MGLALKAELLLLARREVQQALRFSVCEAVPHKMTERPVSLAEDLHDVSTTRPGPPTVRAEPQTLFPRLEVLR